MKLDEVTLQNILKAYGKEVKPSKAKPKIEKDEILETTRIGVDYADDWKYKLWRFCLKNRETVRQEE